MQTVQPEAVTWSICCILANLGICVLGCWRCFANNYLHWAATCTWLLLNLQGKNNMCMKSNGKKLLMLLISIYIERKQTKTRKKQRNRRAEKVKNHE